MRSRTPLACLVLCLTMGWWAHLSAFAADPPADNPQASPSVGLNLKPTATCPQDALDELHTTIEFVRGQTWTDRPGDNALTLVPDLTACRVVLHVGELTSDEEAALRAGAGSRLAIEYRRDWARPSRLLLMLWIVFGGSGLIWVYRRYGRR